MPQLTDAALAGFRKLALIWQRKYMYRQFRAFLRTKYGDDWLAHLLRVRRYSYALTAEAVPSLRKNGSPPPRKWVRRGCVPTEGYLPTRDNLMLHLDSDAGCQVLNRYFGGQWWDWQAGSSLAFWRWNGEEQIGDARDGMRVYIRDTLPENRRPQRPPKPADLRLMIAKLDKVLDRGYISPGWVASLTSYFAVPKGENDIRLVYDGSDSGLNEALWSPSFWLPNSASAV
jgi:hypothetical protein